MTKREQVQKLAAEGKSLRDIAKEMGFKSHNAAQYYLKPYTPSDDAKLKKLIARRDTLLNKVALIEQKIRATEARNNNTTLYYPE